MIFNKKEGLKYIQPLSFFQRTRFNEPTLLTALLSEKGPVILQLKLRTCITALIGSAILAFGLYNIHVRAGVTEGGVLGLTVLLHHWFGISPAISSLILDFICFFLGWRILGGGFLLYSAIASGGFSLFYAIFEQFPPLWPKIGTHPLLACAAGALFVGVGVGLCVRAGGAPGGDDALAMALSHRFRCRIQTIYLVSDLTVLALSASYIPLPRLAYSLLTVVLSGQIIGLIQNFHMPETKRSGNETS